MKNKLRKFLLGIMVTVTLSMPMQQVLAIDPPGVEPSKSIKTQDVSPCSEIDPPGVEP